MRPKECSLAYIGRLESKCHQGPQIAVRQNEESGKENANKMRFRDGTPFTSGSDRAYGEEGSVDLEMMVHSA